MKKYFVLLVLVLAACSPQVQEEFEADKYEVEVAQKAVEGEYEGYYINERFGFRFIPLKDYDFFDMPSAEGAVMTKRISGVDWIVEDKDGNRFPYTVEIKVMGEENVLEYEDLADMVGSKYRGFSMEGYEDEDVSAIFVNEGSAGDAIRHFFFMKNDVIYEAQLKLPSFYFDKHKEEFDAFVKTILFF